MMPGSIKCMSSSNRTPDGLTCSALGAASSRLPSAAATADAGLLAATALAANDAGSCCGGSCASPAAAVRTICGATAHSVGARRQSSGTHSSDESCAPGPESTNHEAQGLYADLTVAPLEMVPHVMLLPVATLGLPCLRQVAPHL
jgi:hypothetical protein